MSAFFRSFFAALLAIFAFCFLIIIILVGSAALSGGGEVTEVEDGSVLHLEFDKVIVDRHYENDFAIGIGMFDEQGKDGLNNILKQIAKAKADDRIEGILIDTQGPAAGLATLQEIRDALVDFKSEGKWIISYADIYTQAGYYLGSAADEVYVQPEGMIELKGLSSNVTFLKGFLDKVGVEVQVIRPSNNKFKSAVEPFILDSMSTANEEQMRKILNSIWDKMADDIASTRGLSREELEEAVMQLKSRSPESARDARLVTDLKYRDEIMAMLVERTEVETEADLELVSLSSYSRSVVNDFVDHEKKYAKEKVAVIYAAGGIGMGEGDKENIGSDGMASMIAEARGDSSIKAIVLRVNSPGGSALASDVIWREMNLAKEVKPVIVSMGDVAASGGYYISCNADKVFASETTITGSIGVFGMIPNTQELNEDILGITHDGVKTHEFSDLMEMSRPMRASEKDVWQDAVDEIYTDFTGKVAQGRGMEQEFVNSIGQGRVWSGVDALENGLIDSYGGLEDAIAEAVDRAGLEEYNVKNYPIELDPVQQILKDLGQEVKADVMEELTSEDLRFYHLMKQYREIMGLKGIQARMPFILDIR